MRQRGKGSESLLAGEVTALFPLRKHHLLFQQRTTVAYYGAINFISPQVLICCVDQQYIQGLSRCYQAVHDLLAVNDQS